MEKTRSEVRSQGIQNAEKEQGTRVTVGSKKEEIRQEQGLLQGRTVQGRVKTEARGLELEMQTKSSTPNLGSRQQQGTEARRSKTGTGVQKPSKEIHIRDTGSTVAETRP